MENNKKNRLNVEIEIPQRINYYSDLMGSLGLTKEAWMVFTIASLLQFIWGCEACFISINLESLAIRDAISKSNAAIGICILYTMMGFGSILVGWMTKKFGRIFTLLITTVLFSCFTIICSLFIRPLSFYPVLFIRCLSNVCLGVFNIVILNLMSEFLPTTNRCLILMINSGFYNLGNLFLILLNFFFIQQNEADTSQNRTNSSSGLDNNFHFDSYKWRLVNFFTSLPGLIGFILILLYQKESPLFLLNKNRDEEAFEIIDKMLVSKGRPSLTEQMKSNIKSSVVSKSNYKLKSDYKELFLPEYIYLTISSLFICSICYLNMIGVIYLVPRSIKELGERKIYNFSYFTQLIIYGVIQLPNGFIGGWMAESNLFGRKRTIWISSLICAVFYFTSYFFPTFMFAYSGQIMHFNSIAYGCVFIYITEAFPTNLRDQAQSLIQFCSFLLGSWTPFIIDQLHSSQIMINFIILGITCILCSFITCLLPLETKSRPLDEEILA